MNMYVTDAYQQKQLWRKKYPAIVGGLLSVFQLIVSLAVEGCERYGDFVHFPRMNAFVGHAAFPLFTMAWISLAGASCCCRIRCCATATVVFQALAASLALCLIGFDAYFLMNPTQCFFSNDCTSYMNYDYGYYYNYYYNRSYYDTSGLLNTTTLYGIKVPLIRGQLAAGVLMFVSSVIYFIIYGITVSRTETSSVSHYREGQVREQAAIQYSNAAYNLQTPVVVVEQPPTVTRPSEPGSTVPTTLYRNTNATPTHYLRCPNCQNTFRVANPNS